jgi:hypothetical protein
MTRKAERSRPDEDMTVIGTNQKHELNVNVLANPNRVRNIFLQQSAKIPTGEDAAPMAL